METRKLDNLGIETSLLGFGCMRFPMKDGRIDEETAEKILDTAWERGVKYFDTAWPYHGGESETFVGKVMEKHPRDSFYLATKLPLWAVNSVDDAKNIFEEQLKKLRTDHIDFYLLHALNGERFDKVLEDGIIPFCEELQKQGKIRYFGFSFHDGYDAFERILTYRKWDFCQIQHNYMDTEEQAGNRGVELAGKLGVPLVIMESIRGGELAALPERIESRFRALRPEASTASWALRWLGTKPEIKVILSGMSSPGQVEDNLNTFDHFEPLSEEEQRTVSEVADMIRKGRINGCTGCSYCMPCPAGVRIPNNFRLVNQYGMYENKDRFLRGYNGMKDEEKASACKKCGKCEQVCPQHLSIRDELENVVKIVSELESM